jgi:hypothetical protein
VALTYANSVVNDMSHSRVEFSRGRYRICQLYSLMQIKRPLAQCGHLRPTIWLPDAKQKAA